MRGILQALLIAFLIWTQPTYAEKPRSPLQVSIAPANPSLSDAKAGDIIELTISGKSVVDADEMEIKVELRGGVELISGQTFWVGPAKKGEEKTLPIKVRILGQGNGEVVARISRSPSKSASFAAEAIYYLDSNVPRKPSSMPKVKKDSKGREIREYQVN